jgi:hypothetical protein
MASEVEPAKIGAIFPGYLLFRRLGGARADDLLECVLRIVAPATSALEAGRSDLIVTKAVGFGPESN